jgi:hypothetical protein
MEPKRCDPSYVRCVALAVLFILFPALLPQASPLLPGDLVAGGSAPFNIDGAEGKRIRATDGIGRCCGTFGRSGDVTGIGTGMAQLRSPGKDALGKEGEPRPRMIAEEDAEDIVWSLPEVKDLVDRMRGTNAGPFAMITGYPAPQAKPGDPSAIYEIYVGENHGTHTVHAMTFLVDAYNGKVSVYDEAAGRSLSLEEYRKRLRK